MKINTKNLKNGFRVYLDKKSIDTIYPSKVWDMVPESVRTELANTAAYFFTHHLPLKNKNKYHYKFSVPKSYSLFFHGLLYSMPEITLDENASSIELFQKLFNSGYHVTFENHPQSILNTPVKLLHTKKVLLPFSMGKDCLLSYALLKELSYDPYLLLCLEPTSPRENVYKLLLKKKFEQEIGTHVNVIDVKLGSLRQAKGMMWGWDMLLMQYTLLFIPYFYSEKAELIVWSNELSTDQVTQNSEGFVVNATFEQNSQWMLNMTNLLRNFGLNSKVVSITKSLYEMLILYILNHRYPQLAKFQHSCLGDFSDAREKRWCGHCYECARVYIFLLAIGVDPKNVGHTENMLSLKKRKLFYLFDEGKANDIDGLFQSYDERLLAFYLIHKRGIKGDLVTLFEKTLLPQVQRKSANLITKYFSVYPSQTVDKNISSQVQKIFEYEAKNLRKEVSSLF